MTPRSLFCGAAIALAGLAAAATVHALPWTPSGSFTVYTYYEGNQQVGSQFVSNCPGQPSWTAGRKTSKFTYSQGSCGGASN